MRTLNSYLTEGGLIRRGMKITKFNADEPYGIIPGSLDWSVRDWNDSTWYYAVIQRSKLRSGASYIMLWNPNIKDTLLILYDSSDNLQFNWMTMEPKLQSTFSSMGYDPKKIQKLVWDGDFIMFQTEKTMWSLAA